MTPTPHDAMNELLDHDDPWARRLTALARRHAGTPPAAGRVLRVKFGYNPNSSSVGSVVSILMWAATAGAVAANVMAALLAERRNASGTPDRAGDE